MNNFLYGILVLCLSLCAQVQAFDIPPYEDFVTDTADIFSREAESQLENTIEKIELETTVEIAVLTIGSTNEVEINEFATKTAHEWGIGKADVDNGLLILIAVDDRNWYLASGYGVEGILPDIQLKRIGEHHFPSNFRAGNYTAGVQQALGDILGYLQQDPGVVSQYEAPLNEIPSWFFWMHLGVLISLIIYWAKVGDGGTAGIISSGWIFAFVGLSVLLSAGIVAYVFVSFVFSFLGLAKGESSRSGWTSGGSWGSGGGYSGGGFGGFGGGGFGGGGAGGSW